jgi:hypothetical protein
MDTIIGIFRNQYVCVELPFAFIVKKNLHKAMYNGFLLVEKLGKSLYKRLDFKPT